jgi:2-polyprenyl-6-methoxyphenol hydroxylase-like FAD-dependent oxidoreductase
VNHRVCHHFHEGNVFLGGDAAHIHSPVGGSGMNIGFEDALVFTELLRKGQLGEVHTDEKANSGSYGAKG